MNHHQNRAGSFKWTGQFDRSFTIRKVLYAQGEWNALQYVTYHNVSLTFIERLSVLPFPNALLFLFRILTSVQKLPFLILIPIGISHNLLRRPSSHPCFLLGDLRVLIVPLL